LAKLLIIMGVSGVGKSTIGLNLADRLGLPFFDGDDFHPINNVEKMKSGVPLNDSDRIPWLKELNRNLIEWGKKNGAILACSALKENYRKILGQKISPEFIYLHGSRKLLIERLKRRKGHFFKEELIDSQLNDLEPPSYGIHLDISENIDTIINKIEDQINNE